MKIIAKLVVLLSLTGSLFADVVLFDNSQSEAVIVLEEEASVAARRAASEFQQYLKKSGGVDVPIQAVPGDKVNIYVGESKYTKTAGLDLKGLTYDGFKIVTKDNSVYVFGRDRREKEPLVGMNSPFQKIHAYNKAHDICVFGEHGTQYAAYYILREFAGIRWFMQGEDGEHVPKLKKLTLSEGMNLAVSPDFEFRFLFVGLMNNDDDFAFWFRRAGFGAPYPVEINHSFYLMNKYQSLHPEWFALYKGQRDFNMTCLKEGNLCLSQPTLVEAFALEARNFFKKSPESRIFPVMPNDWFNQICECPECQAQAEYDKPDYAKFSNYVWRFVNKVAREVAKTHPDKFIGCAAYSSFMGLPDQVKMEPNVAITFTTSTGFRFDDFYRTRNDVWLYDWSQYTKNFYLWNYFCWDMTNPHLSGLPIAFTHWIDKDVKKQKGFVKGTFIEADFGPGNNYRIVNPELNHLNLYILGRLMWDSSLNVDELLEDYYANFYAQSAPELKKFWNRAEEIWTNMNVKKRGISDNLNATLYTPEVLLELKSYLENGMKAVPADSVYARRILGIQKCFYPYVSKVTSTRANLPSHKARRTSVAPVIDGKCDDLWLKAVPMKFVTATDALEPLAPTEAKMLHDDKHIYFLIKSSETKMKAMVAKGTVHDSYSSLAADDTIEIFLAPDATKTGRFVQIIVNSLGTVVDAFYEESAKKPEGDFSYESHAIVKTALQDKSWTLEIAVPKGSFEINAIKPPTRWRMNICRNRNVDNIDTKDMELSSWSSPLVPSWLIPVRFGYLEFE
ncbi:MAG: DUF4838 domain-containing protein [Lentisphaeria bacterium]